MQCTAALVIDAWRTIRKCLTVICAVPRVVGTLPKHAAILHIERAQNLHKTSPKMRGSSCLLQSLGCAHIAYPQKSQG